MIDFLRVNLDLLVFTILGVMSFLMVWFSVERYFYYRRVDTGRFDSEQELNVDLTRHLTLISTIGANAPYIGLLGTVAGILITFYDIGTAGGSVEVGTVLVGLALALKATAMGLLVAIPAIWSYNGLLRKVEVLTALWRRRRGSQ